MAGSLAREKKRKRQEEFYVAYLHAGVFFQANTSILDGMIVYLQLEVNQLEPCTYFLMKMLSPLRYVADALIVLLGQMIHTDILITVACT